MRFNAIIYGPSFLTRYGIQFLIVALPWLLQSKGYSLGQVSQVLLFYNVGSLLVGFLSTRFIHKLNSKKMIMWTGLFQSILAVGAVGLSSMNYISLFMFLQGVCLGLLRPLSKIWIFELSKRNEKNDVVSKAAFSEVLTAVGMTLGSVFGSLAVKFIQNELHLFGYTSICLITPVLVLTYFIRSISMKKLESITVNPKDSFLDFLRWVKNDQSLALVLIIYLMSITVFKIWIVGVPYFLRNQNSSDIEAFLSMVLGLHPIIFMIGQILAAKFVLKRFIQEKWVFLSIGLSTLLQALFVGLGAFLSSKISISFGILLGGGLIAALIYPLCISICEKHMLKHGATFQRQLFLVLALAADIGQLLGSLLLWIFNAFHLTGLTALLVPVCIVLFVMFINMLKLNGEKYHVSMAKI